MTGNNVTLSGRLAEHCNSSLAYVAVRGAVEAVTTNLVFLVILVRKRVHICEIRHSLVEAGIKHSNLRNVHNLLALNDTLKVCRVVKRTEVAALLNDSLRLLGNENRARKLVAAVKNSMTNRANFSNRLNYTKLLIYESIKNELKRLCVSGHSHRELVILSAGNLELEAGLAADFLADTLSDYTLILHIDKLELERRATSIDN